MIGGNSSFFNFIRENAEKDPLTLRLAFNNKIKDFDFDLALVQIEARKKTATKLKDFIANPLFLFPDSISAEQASHQAVARFHASLVPAQSSLLDMTAGLGIDAFSMAQTGNTVSVFDISEKKVSALNHNKEILNLKNFEVRCSDSIEFLKGTDCFFDVIFVDPARRDQNKNRVFLLKDCSPDIVSNLDLILSKTDRLLIKASPLLDIHSTLNEIKDITSIRAVGVKGECKELLVEIDKKSGRYKNDAILFEAINLDKDGKVLSRFSYEISDDKNKGLQDLESLDNSLKFAEISDICPGSYILEPSAMMMKLAPWNLIAERFSARKFDKSSNLFVTNTKPEGFPGRVMVIDRIINKKDRKVLYGLPASVVSRNYPLSSDEIRKNLHLLEGDNTFIYASKVANQPIMILTHSES